MIYCCAYPTLRCVARDVLFGTPSLAIETLTITRDGMVAQPAHPLSPPWIAFYPVKTLTAGEGGMITLNGALSAPVLSQDLASATFGSVVLHRHLLNASAATSGA